jgi:hypothetical protein
MITVSAHARERFCERAGCKSLQRAENELKKLFRGAKRTRRVANVQAILASGFAYADSEYYFNSGWVMVVKDGVIITAYQASPRKFV